MAELFLAFCQGRPKVMVKYLALTRKMLLERHEEDIVV